MKGNNQIIKPGFDKAWKLKLTKPDKGNAVNIVNYVCQGHFKKCTMSVLLGFIVTSVKFEISA